MYFKRTDYRRFDTPIWAFRSAGHRARAARAGLLRRQEASMADDRLASLQPSEFAKPALIIFLAYFIALRLRAINDRHTLWPGASGLGHARG